MIDPADPDYANTPVSPRRPRFGYAPAEPQAEPAVSIVTPFFNPGLVFEETARSVQQQSFQQWEWLIVNDGSTDAESLAVLARYRGADPRIRVIDQAANQGPGAARNAGVRAAQAQVLVLLDSDDLLEPTAIEKWVWYLATHPEAGFVKGYTVGFGGQEYLWEHGFHSGAAFLRDNQVNTTSAVRRAAFEAAGGYDESIRAGLEDWDFWLRCADRGWWGATLPEFNDWYRRRAAHSERWQNWDQAERQRAFHNQLRQRYPRLWQVGFPQVTPRWPHAQAPVIDEVPFHNRLAGRGRRLLLVIPHATVGGADRFNLELVEQLGRRGWEVTAATTLADDHSWLPRLAALTPDVFALHRFLHLEDYPRFLRYLIASRQIDTVLLSHSEAGYRLLPYLRAHAPQAAFVDYCHIEETYWKNGGYPAMAVEHQALLDLTLVSSQHLRGWMRQRGADAERIEVCYLGVEAERWAPDLGLRQMTRQELGLADDTPLLLYAARLVDQKQPRVLAETLRRLRLRGERFAALVAGDGPEAGWLQRFVHDQGLAPAVRLLGSVPPERMRALLAAADLYFLPSKWEGIALSIYEAMAAGLPVVAAAVGGQAELVTPECGVLLPRGSEETEAEQYAQTLAGLLRDPRRRQTLGTAGRERVCQHFRLDQMGQRVDDCLARAHALRRAQPRATPDLALGRLYAAQAVENMRLNQLADRLWAERHGLAPPAPAGDWRQALYQRLYRWHEPYYRWYSQRGWVWLAPVREAVKRALLRSADRAHK